MLTMLRNDLIHHPTGQISKATLTKIKNDFDSSTFKPLSTEERQQVQ